MARQTNFHCIVATEAETLDIARFKAVNGESELIASFPENMPGQNTWRVLESSELESDPESESKIVYLDSIRKIK